MTISPTSSTVPTFRAAARPTARSGGSGWKHRARRAPYLFLAPYFLVTTVFFMYPLAYAAVLAFHYTNGPMRWAYVGFSNFAFILRDPDFHKALWNTTVFALFSIFLQLPLSLGLAMLLNVKSDRLKSFFRLAIFSPNLVGSVFVGILFSMLFTPRYGLFNRFLQSVFGWGLEQQWLGNPQLVMPAIVLASLWMYVGFNMVYFLAGLQNVDQGLIEAARIDGAGPVGIFFNVTLPSIAPVATFVVVTSTIGSYQLFELPYTLLQSFGGGYGPKNSGLTVVGYLYQQMDSGDFGTAAAVGWVLTFIIIAVSLVQIRLWSRVGSEK